MTTRPTLTNFKEKALANNAVKQEYEALSLAYDLRKKLIAIRKTAGLTQEELAAILSTKKAIFLA
jgi:DNA-binding XRE family transcriptional regulator